MSQSLVLSGLLVAAALILLVQTTSSHPFQAGYESLVTEDGTEVGIWYPASGQATEQSIGLTTHEVAVGGEIVPGRHPLVVMSHGTGGHLGSHADTASSLARAGFIVGALTHKGDNWQDTSRATEIEARPVALSGLISFLLDRWSGRAAIDGDRIGAFGFSAGGFTVLAAAGGRPDMSRIEGHCSSNPTEFVCELLRAQPHSVADDWPDLSDRRIKAIVVAAPALGFAFHPDGLIGTRLPVQLWRADEDGILPPAHHADMIRSALPDAPEFHAVPGAGHYDFLAPCANPSLAPDLCTSAGGFGRAVFHREFNSSIARFFSRHLN